MKYSLVFKKNRQNIIFKPFFLLIILICILIIAFSLSSIANQNVNKPENYISGIVDPDGSLKRVMEAKLLMVGADPNTGLPYIKKESYSNEFSGFEVDIAKFIASKMGCEIKIIPTNWVNLLKGLEEKKYDIALNAIEKPQDNKSAIQKLGFSDYYFINSQYIFIHKDNKRVKFLSNLKNKRVGVLNNSVAKVLVTELNKQKNAKIILIMYSNTGDLFSSLNKKIIEAIIIDSPIGTWNCGKEKYDCKEVSLPILSQNYVVAVRKEDRSLLNAIDVILRTNKKNNKIDNVLKKWNLE